MHRRRVAVAVVAGLLGSVGASAAAADLTVSAAASLTQAFRDIGEAYGRRHPEVTVRLNFGASGALLQQIVRGAPVDVFASADRETMRQAQQQHAVRAGATVDFARNELVVVVPRAAPTAAAIDSLAALATPAVRRVAIGLPASVPAGRYARDALEQAGLWPAVERRVVGAQTVRQALDYVARGEVDAGIVYRTDAALLGDRVRVAFAVATSVPVIYPIAPVAASPVPGEARRFVDFVVSPAGRAILARHGFAAP